VIKIRIMPNTNLALMTKERVFYQPITKKQAISALGSLINSPALIITLPAPELLVNYGYK